MKLLKITPKNTLVFELKDGRLGMTYESGYVRVTLTGLPGRIYQINKKVLNKKDAWERILIPNHADRVRHLLAFENKNCK